MIFYTKIQKKKSKIKKSKIFVVTKDLNIPYIKKINKNISGFRQKTLQAQLFSTFVNDDYLKLLFSIENFTILLFFTAIINNQTICSPGEYERKANKLKPQILEWCDLK